MSSRYSAYYARNKNEGSFKLIEFISGSPEFEDNDLKELSTRYVDAIYMAEQENTGFVHYEHWQDGLLRRRLKYNSDYAWISADGEPEEWEKHILFSEEHRNLLDNSYEQHEEIAEAWEKKYIQAGDQLPDLGFLNLMEILRKYWHLSD